MILDSYRYLIMFDLGIPSGPGRSFGMRFGGSNASLPTISHSVTPELSTSWMLSPPSRSTIPTPTMSQSFSPSSSSDGPRSGSPATASRSSASTQGFQLMIPAPTVAPGESSPPQSVRSHRARNRHDGSRSPSRSSGIQARSALGRTVRSHARRCTRLRSFPAFLLHRLGHRSPPDPDPHPICERKLAVRLGFQRNSCASTDGQGRNGGDGHQSRDGNHSLKPRRRRTARCAGARNRERRVVFQHTAILPSVDIGPVRPEGAVERRPNVMRPGFDDFEDVVCGTAISTICILMGSRQR